MRLSSAQLGKSLDKIVECGRLERDLDEAEGFSDLTDAVRDMIRGVKLGENLEEILNTILRVKADSLR